MGIIENLKKAAKKYDIPQGDAEEQQLTKIINALFLLPKKPEIEAQFVQTVATRGLETQERRGLHASGIIASDDKFCYRAQVLCQFYKQDGSKNLPVNLLRIFEEGNAVHEKIQRLFLRGGLSKVNELDCTCYDKRYNLYYSPDIICRIAEFSEEPMIGEIKSMNLYSYDVNKRHPTASLQLQLYLYLTKLKHGFVLCENKNSQEFKIEYCEYNFEIVKPYIGRLEKVRRYTAIFAKKKRLIARPAGCSGPTCKKCENCIVKSTCWKMPGGGQRL